MTDQSPKSLMTFERVLEDYLFFQQHITEIDEMRRHFGVHISKKAFKNRPVKYLDFGCGDGSIPLALETEVPNLKGNTHFAIVEPTDAQREAAVKRLTPVSQGTVIAYPYLPETPEEHFDLILASHCLYYVPDLETTVKKLYDTMSDDSLFIITMECSDSPTKKIWDVFFGSIGRPIPFHLSESVKQTLDKLAIEYEIDPLEAKMEFPDTIENRRHVARFLLDMYYPLQAEEKTLSFFDRFSSNGKISAKMTNDLFVIKKRRKSV